MTTALTPTSSSGPDLPADALEPAGRWFEDEKRRGTLLTSEPLWREAHARYRALLPTLAEGTAAAAWAAIADHVVFELPSVPVNERRAAAEALDLLRARPGLSASERARRLHRIARAHDVLPAKILGLLGPGVGYPWGFSRALWTADVVGTSMEALLAAVDWSPGQEPDGRWLAGEAAHATVDDFLVHLRARAPQGSDLDRMIGALAGLFAASAAENRDPSVQEAHSFIAALEHHGLTSAEIERLWPGLETLRSAVVLLHSFQLHLAAERCVTTARRIADADGGGDATDAALRLLRRGANIYKRVCVAQLYPEPLLARHQELYREMEQLRADKGRPDRRCQHLVLVSTFNSPADLQRLVQSLWHELAAFGYGPTVHVVVSDDSTGEALEQGRDIVAQAARAGMSISHWDSGRKNAFLDALNAEVFPDGRCDVWALAGGRTPGEKGVPYGRFRNFLRLAALRESRALGLRQPVSTWLDQDNEVGALVLTRASTLAKRHVFNYFDQKSTIFENGDVVVGGGGYTNDALEGVEKFWVAWGILNHTFDLARRRPPEAPPLLPSEADITRFRPWDQPETLERLIREGDDVETFADQVLLLLATLAGTFQGKYENQVQVYHPWTFGRVVPGDEALVEETRPFAGMPGGNTSFAESVLASPIPFITVGGRGEDIFHLWQVESEYGVGMVHLTHTPALHTRNMSTARSDLMAEIVDSYNGRIFREPPYLWAALSRLSLGGDACDDVSAEVEAETADRINNLRAEAMSNIAAVSGFAAALEPYLDEGNDFWWLRQAARDPRYAARVAELRSLAERFKHPEPYQAQADEKLLRLADVKDLTRRFLSAYPHWATVVAHVGGLGSERAPGRVSGAAARFPDRPYGGAPARSGEAAAPVPSAPGGPELAVAGDPMAEPPWRDVVNSALLLYRRYELGRAAADQLLSWDERVARLSEAYHHYAAMTPDVPGHAWTLLYRDALLVPHTRAYAAVSSMVTEDFAGGGDDEQERRMGELAEAGGVDVSILREARTPAPAAAGAV
ncbi:MAG: hypothetical protein ABR511_00760 [Acidimicrobiales bacterium]